MNAEYFQLNVDLHFIYVLKYTDPKKKLN